MQFTQFSRVRFKDVCHSIKAHVTGEKGEMRFEWTSFILNWSFSAKTFLGLSPKTEEGCKLRQGGTDSGGQPDQRASKEGHAGEVRRHRQRHPEKLSGRFTSGCRE